MDQATGGGIRPVLALLGGEDRDAEAAAGGADPDVFDRVPGVLVAPEQRQTENPAPEGPTDEAKPARRTPRSTRPRSTRRRSLPQKETA